MATHSSILAWRIPWTEELCRLLFIVSQRVGRNRALTHTHDGQKNTDNNKHCKDTETLESSYSALGKMVQPLLENSILFPQIVKHRVAI